MKKKSEGVERKRSSRKFDTSVSAGECSSRNSNVRSFKARVHFGARGSARSSKRTKRDEKKRYLVWSLPLIRRTIDFENRSDRSEYIKSGFHYPAGTVENVGSRFDTYVDTLLQLFSPPRFEYRVAL